MAHAGLTSKQMLVHLIRDSSIQGPKSGRKVGRPILYTGDPSAPGLTSLKRQTIARRNSNRQSARRIRLRRQDQVQQLQDEVSISMFQVGLSRGDVMQYRGHKLHFLCLNHLLLCLSLPLDIVHACIPQSIKSDRLSGIATVILLGALYCCCPGEIPSRSQHCPSCTK